jgi:phage major head subunit gpT-like protein
MKLTRDNFGQLLTPIHKKIVWETYNEKPEEYPRIFKIGTMDRKEISYPHMGGFGMWDENEEGGVINQDTMHEGEVATFTTARYDKGYPITWELVQDDLYNVMRGMGSKGGSAQALGKGLRVTCETLAADVINNGFTNTGYDGVSLFDNDHPLADSSSYGNNLISGALSDSTLKTALTNFRSQVDEANLKIQAIANRLFVAANLEFTAYTIQRSEKVADELSNNANVLPRLEIIIMDYLTDGYWGIQDSSIENLLFFWRNKPLFDGQPIQSTLDWLFFGYARMTCGYNNWRGIAASAGA